MAEEYVWDVKLECGHELTVEKFVPGPPAGPFRCFHPDHSGEFELSYISTAVLADPERETDAP